MANHGKPTEKPPEKNETPAVSAAGQSPPSSSLPSDAFTRTDAKVAAEEAPGPAQREQIAAVDALVKHLFQGPGYFKAGVPEALDRWQPVYEQVLSGTRPRDGEPDLDKAREVAKKAIMRVYAGATAKEKILIIRIPATTYLRSEIIPWTIGK